MDYESDRDFKIEQYEEYYGNAKQVKKIIDNCRYCKSKLVFTHLASYKNLYMQEVARCPVCNKINRKKLHILN